MVRQRRLAGFVFFSGLGLLTLTFHGCSDDSEGSNITTTPDASSGGVSTGGLNLGGDPSSGGTNSGGSNRGGTSGRGGSGGGTGGNVACVAVGEACDAHGDCCSATCDPDLNVCAMTVGTCKLAGDSCGAPTECCTGVCNNGECGATVCISDNEACTESSQCCGAVCESDTCQPLNPECRTAGNSCTNHESCCSGYCDGGRCSGRPSFCVQLGDACAADADCCGGLCAMASGDVLGTCAQPSAPGATQCLLAGQLCGVGVTGEGGAAGAPSFTDAGVPLCGGECCSRACAPYRNTGVMICQPPSGCRPTGEICVNDSDCCGGPGTIDSDQGVVCEKEDGAPVGRCDNGGSCRAAGQVCKLATSTCRAENNCCAGNVNGDPTVCQQDLLGIPRCTGAGDCTQAGNLIGQPCNSSADCCGLPCLPDLNAGAGDPPFICGPSCVESGGACTTDADCCAGLPCNLTPGSTRGTCGGDDPPDGGTGGSGMGGSPPDCAFIGQDCSVDADCCNNVPCIMGTCRYQIF